MFDGKASQSTNRIEVGSCNGFSGNYIREINTLVFAQRGSHEILFEHELIDSVKPSCEKKRFLGLRGSSVALGVGRFVGRSPIPMTLETGCRSGGLLMETPKSIQETRERTEHLSMPRALSLFLFFLLLACKSIHRELLSFMETSFQK